MENSFDFNLFQITLFGHHMKIRLLFPVVHHLTFDSIVPKLFNKFISWKTTYFKIAEFFVYFILKKSKKKKKIGLVYSN